jgi:hypothetical protein
MNSDAAYKLTNDSELHGGREKSQEGKKTSSKATLLQWPSVVMCHPYLEKNAWIRQKFHRIVIKKEVPQRFTAMFNSRLQ